MTKVLVKAIHTQTDRLTLVVSTTAAHLHTHPVTTAILFEAADLLSPQLYDKLYGLNAGQIEREMKRVWLPYRKPMIAALDIACPGPERHAGRCSKQIFMASLSHVAKLSRCGPPGTRIPKYVI